ncbi:hypothetical protein ALT_4850 [Aspergillus lentulus]|uniref:Uncharacterized protein n=1 Tax=Aspergillus lentulus TaxID=293939 RepID=A0AAN4PJ77_ASPLE|nr:hypothetical protein ALT_4850 [Aspergillus lentulus]
MGARAAGHRANGADRAGPTSPRRGGVPSEPVRTQVIPSDRPRGRWRAAAYGPRVGGPDPADTPTKGGSRGAAPPGNLGIRTGQRPTIHRLHRCRGPNGPRASVIPAMWGSRAFLSTARNEPGTGARRMSRGSRARPLLDAPNTVDSLDDPTKDAARRPLESRNHGWDGRLPPFLKRGPTEGTLAAQSSHATRGDAALAFHIEPPTSTGPTSVRANVPGSGTRLAGGPFCMGWSVRRPARPYKVGLSGSPVAWAARGLGHSRRLARARGAGRGQPAPAPWPHSIPALTSVLFINYISALPPAPANWSPPRARPVTRCRRARAGQLVTPAARAPGLYRSQCLCVSVGVCIWRARPRPTSTPVSVWRAPANWSLPGRARARPLSTPASVSVCLYSVCRWRAPLPAGLPPPPKGPRQLATSRARPAPRPVHAGVRPPARRPPTAPTRPANWPPPSPTARSPARLPSLSLSLSLLSSPSPPLVTLRARTPAGPRRRRPPGPYNGARARLSARYEARAPAQLPSTSTWTPRWPPACLPACLPRAPPTALLLHIPTDPDRPAIVRANVPGSEVVPGGGPLALAARAPPARPCAPANWPPPFVTRRRRARVPAAGQGARAAISAGQLAAGDKAPYARGPDAVPPLPFGPVPGEGTGPNTQAVLEGSNDARTGMPPGIPGGAILHTFRTAFMLGSSAGAGPGARGLPGGRRNGGPAEATRFTYGNLVTTFTSSK